MVVDVPFDVVPWKYTVPPDPPLVFNVVELQNVPPPDTLTVVGTGFITTAALPCVPQHPAGDWALK